MTRFASYGLEKPWLCFTRIALPRRVLPLVALPHMKPHDYQHFSSSGQCSFDTDSTYYTYSRPHYNTYLDLTQWPIVIL